MDNCYEAVLKVSENANRFVKIESHVANDYQLITITNSSNTTQMREKTRTSKKNKLLHGFGLNIINEIIENIGGFILYKKISLKKDPCFQLILHIPVKKPDELS